jgi:hypothetical protein
MRKQEYLKSLVGILLNGGVNILVASATGGLAPGNSILGELVKSITGNLASTNIATLSTVGFNRLVSALNENNPDKVNHDLERLFREASVVALEYIKKLFFQDVDKVEGYSALNKQEKKEFIANLKYFFDENINDLRMMMQHDMREPIDKAFIKDPKQILTNITEQIFRISSVSFDEVTRQGLKAFYANHLPYCFELAFKEALKHDDTGFKAFQIWALEDVQRQSADLLIGQQKISDAIQELKNGGNYLNKETEEKKWEAITTTLYSVLEKYFEGINEEFALISENISSRFDELVGSIKVTNEIVFRTESRVEKLLDDTKVMLQLTEEIRESQIKSTKRSVKRIEKNLSDPPFSPQYFIGRTDELNLIRQKFLAGIKIIPISGEGGLGKSSLASAYYHSFSHEYQHVAWVLKEGSIVDSILTLAASLNLTFNNALPANARVEKLLKAMTSLPKPCLLILDNVNDKTDVEHNHQLLRKFQNFHILITTRLKIFGTTDVHVMKALPKAVGLQLFNKYYKKHSSSEDELFYKLYDSISGNTLVIELLAKNLNVLNRFKIVYTLGNLIHELQKKGVLALSKTTEVTDVDYHTSGGIMRKETPEAIIKAMYEFSDLNEKQVPVLSVLAVLPAENIAYNSLQLMLSESQDSDDTLHSLYENGWLDFNEITSDFKISPIVQEIVRLKNNLLLDNCLPLIECLMRQLGRKDTDSSIIFLRYSVSVLETLTNINQNDSKKLDNDKKDLLGLFCYTIAAQYYINDNALQTSKFILLAIDIYEEIITDTYFENLKIKFTEGTILNNELLLMRHYQRTLELAAATKSYLGFLRECGDLYYKALNISKIFQISFDAARYHRYLTRAGRLMEAEGYFFNNYKEGKRQFNRISNLKSEEDLMRAFDVANQKTVLTYEQLEQEAKMQATEAYKKYKSSSLDLAKLFRIQGRFEEAFYFHNKFIELVKNESQVNSHLQSAIGWHSMAIALIMEGKNLALAEQLLEKVLETYTANFNENHLFVGQYNMSLFQVILKKGNPIKQCMHLYEKAKKIISENLGDDSTDIIEMHLDIYEHLKDNSQVDEDSSHLEETFENMLVKTFVDNLEHTIDKFGIYHPVLHRGLETTALILGTRNKQSDAANLRNKRKEFIRILNIRTEVRTYNLPSKKIVEQLEKYELVNKMKSVTSLPIDMEEFELELVELPIYKNYDLCRISFLNTLIKTYKYVLVSKNDAIAVETTNDPIYFLNETNLQLSEKTVKYYATFFFDAVVGDQGKFYIMNDYKDIPWQVDTPIEEKFKGAFATVVSPIEVISSDEDTYILTCNILFDRNLFESKIRVNKQNGVLELFDETLVLVDTKKLPFSPLKCESDAEYFRLRKMEGIMDEIPACINIRY